MYTEEENQKSFKGIFIKIVLVVVILFVLMFLFPTKGFVTNYIDKKLEGKADGNFNSNIIALATAGSGYYNESRLPNNTGDTSKMTLKEMLDEKIIVNLTDNTGVSCSKKSSYVEVAKEENEYTMKVNLSCGGKTDFIILHMGLDGKQFPSTSTARCTFVKNLDEAWTYGEWSSWGTEKIEESSTVQVEKSTKTSLVGSKPATREEFEKANPNVYHYTDGRTYYVCPKKYDNSGVFDNPVTCQKKYIVYYDEPIYNTVTYYRSRTKTFEEAKEDKKEANCDDQSLINDGYVKLD